jgi:hypothetical protein
MRDWHADDLAFLAAVVFALSSLPIAFAAIAIALALGSPGILVLIALVCAYGVLTEIHVRRRMQAALPAPVGGTRSRLGMLPRQGRIHVSFSAHLEWSIPEDDPARTSPHPEFTGGLTLDLDCTTAGSPDVEHRTVSAQINAAHPGQLTGALVAQSGNSESEPYGLER